MTCCSTPKFFKRPLHTTNLGPNSHSSPGFVLPSFLSLAKLRVSESLIKRNETRKLTLLHNTVTWRHWIPPMLNSDKLCAVIETGGNAQGSRSEQVTDDQNALGQKVGNEKGCGDGTKRLSFGCHFLFFTKTKNDICTNRFLCPGMIDISTLKAIVLFDPSKKMFLLMENNQPLVLQEHFYFDISSTNLWFSMY